MDDLTKRFIDSYDVLKQRGIVKNDSELATKLEISRSLITEIMKGRSNPGSKALQNFVKYFPIDGTWLLTGEGNMDKQKTISYTIETVEDMKAYEPEVSIQRKAKISGIDHEVKTIYLTPQIITVDKTGFENIVYVAAKARAGYLNGYGDPEYMESLPSFNIPGLTDATYRAFEVEGDSMYPTLENKEMVIGQWVEKLEYIRDDRVHIVVTKNDGIIVKRLLNRLDKYRFIVAKSDSVNNRDLYPNITLYPDDILEVWYAVWHGGFNFKSPGDLWHRQNNLEADLTAMIERIRKLETNLKP